MTCRELMLERFHEGHGAYESSKRAPLTCAQGQRKRSHDTNSPNVGSIVPVTVAGDELERETGLEPATFSLEGRGRLAL